MGSEKKFFPEFRVYSPSDLSKEWHVEWRNEQGERRKRRTGINQHDTIEARQVAAEQLIEQIKREYAPPESSHEEAARQWLADLEGTVSYKTYIAYKGKIDDFFKVMNGQTPTPALVQEYFRRLQRTLHPTTYNKYREQLNKVFREIGVEGLFDEVQAIKSSYTPDLIFQKKHVDQLKQVIAHKDPQLWLFIQFIHYCFLRPNEEARLLRGMNIMLDEDLIYLPGKKAKNRKTTYKAIPRCFKKALCQLPPLMPNEYVFPSPILEDRPIGKNTFWRRHRDILKKLGYPKGYTIYSWRHTGAVRFIKAGGSVFDLNKMMDHHSLDQTAQYLRQMGIKHLTTVDRFPEL